MSLATLMTEDRRLVILRLLADQQGYSLNESVTQTALGEFGHEVTRDTVRAEFAWLAEQGLVTVEIVGGRIHVASLTGRGEDVARGRAKVPGVKTPSAGSLP